MCSSESGKDSPDHIEGWRQAVSRPGPMSSWEILKVPIRIQGTEHVPIRSLAPSLIFISVTLGLILGSVLDHYNLRINELHLTGILAFSFATFLALVSIVAMYSTFVYQEISHRKSDILEEIKNLSYRIGAPLGPLSLENPWEDSVLKKLKEEPDPQSTSEWISLHRTLQVKNRLAEYMRHYLERLLAITAILVIPSLILLPLAPLLVQASIVSVGVLTYVVLFSILLVWNTLLFIVAANNIIYEKMLIVALVDGEYTLVSVLWRQRPPL